MKKWSHWAAAHPRTAQLLIALSHFALFINALILGSLWFFIDFNPSMWLALGLGHVFFIAFFLYPKKGANRGPFRYSYNRQKIHDFTLVLTCSMMVALTWSNFLQSDESDKLKAPARVEFISHQNTVVTGQPLQNKVGVKVRQQTKVLKKQIKKEFRQLKKQFKSQQSENDGTLGGVLLILLTVVVALGLGLLVASLSCSLSCSGMEGLAIAVLIVGWTGIIWLSILAIKRILQRMKARKNAGAIESGTS
jgi:hypothetical protein